MIVLDIKIDVYADDPNIDWSTVGDVLLDYDLFCGDFVFVVDGADFSTDWGWVPTLNFATSMRRIGDRLLQLGEAVFEFTDTDEEIRFNVLNAGILQIEASYVDGVGYVALTEFCEATVDLLDRTRRMVETAAPGLLENRRYKRVLGPYW